MWEPALGVESHMTFDPYVFSLASEPSPVSSHYTKYPPATGFEHCLLWVRIPWMSGSYGGYLSTLCTTAPNPDHLITDGMYKYLQHPSYTGAALVTLGMTSLLMCWDIAAGAWSTLAALNIYGWLFTAALGISLFSVLEMWVRVEETVLHEQFGREWEKWHVKTKSFISLVD